MEYLKKLLKNIILLFKKESEYSKLKNFNFDSIMYKKIESKYKDINEIKNILDIISNYNNNEKAIILPIIGNNETNKYFIFEFVKNFSNEEFNYILETLSLCKNKLDLYKNMSDAVFSVNVRRIEPHIINMEITIKQIYNYLTLE